MGVEIIMKNVGVIGAGTMGRGVAEAFATKGYQVVLVDCSEKALDEAKVDIRNITRFKILRTKDVNALKPDEVLENIVFTQELGLLKNAEFLVENVCEKWEVKAEIYPQIDEICPKDTIFAANTSCISITKIASLTRREDKVIGIHFMNPVEYINSVEVIKGYKTSEDTQESVQKILESIGKEAIVINDYPGFVSNRISHLMMNEAAFIIQDGVARPEEVDDIMKKCYGHTMGPLETADLIGLDTVVDSLDVLYDSFKDSKFRCCPLLRKMVDAGLKGRKSGEGFYKY